MANGCTYTHQGKQYNEYEILDLYRDDPDQFQVAYDQIAGTETVKANKDTIAKMKTALDRMGVSLETVQANTRISSNGVADILKGLIQIVEGKEDVALTEETMHFAVEIIEQTNPSLFNQMFNKVGSYRIMDDVYRDYSSNPNYRIDGKPDVRKLKKEAIGKVLAETIIQQNEGIIEKPEKVVQAQSWWRQIIDWLASRFSKSYNPFETVAKDILKGEIPNVNVLNENREIKALADRLMEKKGIGVLSDTFKYGYDARDYRAAVSFIHDQLKDDGTFEATVEQALGGDLDLAYDILQAGKSYLQIKNPKQMDLFNKLREERKNTVNQELPSGDNGYFRNGVEVKNRVTKKVKQQSAYKFKNRKVTPEQLAKEDDLKGFGKAGHADMEDIFKRYITSEGELRIAGGVLAPLPRTITPNMTPGDTRVYDELEKYVAGLLVTYPEGTKFLIEQVGYDQSQDMAGTMDFLAILPDEGKEGFKVDVLDWKFKRLNTSKFEDIPYYSVEEWQAQMVEYRKMLGKYGVQQKDFRKTRMVPIITDYGTNTETKKLFVRGVEIGPVNLEVDGKSYLLPVATPDETTGNIDLDKFIEKLNALHKTLSNTKVEEGRRDLKAEQLNAVYKAIRHLQIEQNFQPLFDQIEVLIRSTQRIIENHNQKYKDADINSIASEDIAEHSRALVDAAQNLAVYKDVSAYFQDYFEQPDVKDAAKNFEELSKLSSQVGLMAKKLEKTYKEFGSKFIAEKRGVKNLLEAEKVIKGLGKMFNTLSQHPTAALKTLWKMTDNAQQKTDIETNQEVQRIQAIQEKVKEEAQAKGISEKEHLDSIKKQGKGKKRDNVLIDEFNKEFYTEALKRIDDKDTKWIKDNIDNEAFKAWAAKYKTTREQQIKDTVYPGNEEAQEERRTRDFRDLEEKTNLNQDAAWLNYYAIKQFPIRDKWESAEYKNLKASPALFSFYNYIKEWNTKAVEADYLQREQARTFLPFVRRGVAEGIVFGGKWNAPEGLIAGMTLDDQEVGYGSYDPITGELVDTIPIYFTRDISEEKTDEKGNKYKDYSNVSEDLFKNIAVYVSQVIDYSNKVEIESQANLMYFIESNKQSLQTNGFGNLIPGVGGNPVKSDDNSENAKLFQNYVKNTIYGQRYTSNTDFVGGKMGKVYNKFANLAAKVPGMKNVFPVISDDVANRNISFTKSIDTANRAFQLKVLGVNIGSSISQFLGGNFQALINAGTYYNSVEFFKAEARFATHKLIKDDAKHHIGLMKLLLPVDSKVGQRIRGMSLSKVTGADVSEMIMYFMRTADETVQYTNYMAMVDNAIVVDGKIHNARQYAREQPDFVNRYNLPAAERRALEKGFQERVDKLKKEFGLESKLSVVDDKLQIEGIADPTGEEVREFRSLIRQVGATAAGNILEGNESLMRLNVITKSVMVFKNWVPRLVQVRAGGLSHNTATDQWEWGRMRMVMKVLFTDGLFRVDKLKDMLSANEKGVTELRKMFETKKAEFLKTNGRELEMTETEFFDLVRQNIKSQIKDLTALMSLIGIMLAAKHYIPDEEEDKGVLAFYRYSVRTVDKVTGEVSFFYNPLSVQQILNGNIFPSFGVLTDVANVIKHLAKEGFGLVINDKELVEDAKPAKYIMKTFPVTKEVLNYLAFFAPELAKSMGIQITSEARR